jgi:hypothetical protein
MSMQSSEEKLMLANPAPLPSTALVGFDEEQIDLTVATRALALKWAVVVDQALPPGRAVNAAICVAASTMSITRGVLGPEVADADGTSHPGLPWLGCTVLGAPSHRVATIRRTAIAQAGMAVSDMPMQAQHTRVYDDYRVELSQTPSDDLSYYAVSVIGPRKAVDKLVKGLALLP